MELKKIIETGLGKHFIGLWIYQPYGKTRKWCVTFRDISGEYWETDLFNNPEGALKQAGKVIKQQQLGKKVKATGENQSMDG